MIKQMTRFHNSWNGFLLMYFIISLTMNIFIKNLKAISFFFQIWSSFRIWFVLGRWGWRHRSPGPGNLLSPEKARQQVHQVWEGRHNGHYQEKERTRGQPRYIPGTPGCLQTYQGSIEFPSQAWGRNKNILKLSYRSQIITYFDWVTWSK